MLFPGYIIDDINEGAGAFYDKKMYKANKKELIC